MLAAVAIGTLAFGGAASASVKAAAPGWRTVYTKHYGTASNYSGYNTVVATSKGSAWAFGSSNLAAGNDQFSVAAHWNGRAWTTSSLPSGVKSEIIAASAPAANDVWAVSFFGGWVLHWNGAKWLVAKHPSGGGELTGVTALSPTNVWVFGGSGYAGGLGTWHYNGRTWSEWGRSAVGLQVASALSATNIWAIGGSQAPDSRIAHYNGTWGLVSASALNGLQFGGILATSASNVWATAFAVQSNRQVPYLVHYNGRWTRYQLPWAVVPGRTVVADGHGGVWLTAMSTTTGQMYFVHRTAAGVWSRTLAVSAAKGEVDGLAQIPGTASLWAAGFTVGKTGGNAVVWADGAV